MDAHCKIAHEGHIRILRLGRQQSKYKWYVMSIFKTMYGIELLEEFQATFQCSVNENFIHNFIQYLMVGYAWKYNHPTFSII